VRNEGFRDPKATAGAGGQVTASGHGSVGPETELRPSLGKWAGLGRKGLGNPLKQSGDD
jgi:hypothetical protein